MDHSFCLLYGNYGADSYQEARKYQASGIDVYGSLRRRRSKKKNYVCPKCGNGYTVVKSLKRHLRYECGVAPRFKCPYCGTRSKQRAHVNEHIRRKHSGQRIYIIDSPWSWRAAIQSRYVHRIIDFPSSLSTIRIRIAMEHISPRYPIVVIILDVVSFHIDKLRVLVVLFLISGGDIELSRGTTTRTVLTNVHVKCE